MSKRPIKTDTLSLIAKLLAPYLSVGIFWCWGSNGWLAILGYHAQILIWSCGKLRFDPLKLVNKRLLLLALPLILAGPLLLFLIPHITHVPVTQWLQQFHLTGISFTLMVPYFGLIHPYLEQLHWTPLRRKTLWANLIFAGYHMLVLYSLLTPPWMLVAFTVLTTASFAWHWMNEKTKNSLLAIATHIAADLSFIAAVWMAIHTKAIT